MNRSTLIVRLAGVGAVAFALFVLAWLVWNAQRGANVAPEPSGENRLLRDPVVGPVENIRVEPDPTLLPSTKAARLEVVDPAPAAPRSVKAAKPPRTFLPSSKTITLPPVPNPPVLVFPPSKPVVPPGPNEPKR
jgi:hypothetical protein